MLRTIDSDQLRPGMYVYKLLGPLSARLSYNIQFESRPPVGRVNTDTTGRASLVYAF